MSLPLRDRAGRCCAGRGKRRGPGSTAPRARRRSPRARCLRSRGRRTGRRRGMRLRGSAPEHESSRRCCCCWLSSFIAFPLSKRVSRFCLRCGRWLIAGRCGTVQSPSNVRQELGDARVHTPPSHRRAQPPDRRAHRHAAGLGAALRAAQARAHRGRLSALRPRRRGPGARDEGPHRGGPLCRGGGAPRVGHAARGGHCRWSGGRGLAHRECRRPSGDARAVQRGGRQRRPRRGVLAVHPRDRREPDRPTGDARDRGALGEEGRSASRRSTSRRA